jgi:2-keto-4-pentenoate hydratase
MVGRDLPDLRVVLEQDGVVVGAGVGSAALGDPAVCVTWLARALSRHGERLEAGDVVLSGALHAAVTATPGGTFTARFDRIGSVSAAFPSADDADDRPFYQNGRP